MCVDEWDNPHVDDDEKARRRKTFAELRLPSVAQHAAQRCLSPERSPERSPETPCIYDMDIPVRGIMYLFGVDDEPVLYTSAISAYDCSAPVHDPSAPQYQCPRRPPLYSPTSAVHAPSSPAYSPYSPVYAPTGPAYSPKGAPVYLPISPAYYPTSPTSPSSARPMYRRVYA